MTDHNHINVQNTTTFVAIDYYNCPNCWGYFQWDGRECLGAFDIDKGSDNEVKSRNGFIRNFVKRFIG